MSIVAIQSEYPRFVSDFVARDPQILINGKWAPSAGTDTLAVIDPSSRREIGFIADATQEDVNRAVSASRRAFEDGRWTGLPPATRERMLHRLADLIEKNAAELAALEAIDNGKPRAIAIARDVPAAIGYFRYMAGWATKITGLHSALVGQATGQHHAYSRREPIGVAALIVPWNFPLLMAAFKLAPALAAGCTMILKPAELTSLTALRLGELVLEANIPDGVVNIITGRGDRAGDMLVRHPGVDKVSFTGSTLVGKHISRAAADTLKPVTLELGGKSPMIVMGDADIEKAISGAANGIFSNSGQVCIASSRLFVERRIYDRVIEGIADHARQLRLGPSLVASSEIGPLVSLKQQERVMGYIDGARKQGASIVTGGKAGPDSGFYVEPTILADVTSDMPAMRDEIFGPVLCVTPFDDQEEVVRLANDTDFGLAASVWTRDVGTMHRLAAKIDAGIVWGNCHLLTDVSLPVGGFKESGIGQEHGLEGLLHYTRLKAVMIAL